MNEDLCAGRVCIVTGAGRGIGRAEALLLAAQGAKVVVNDLGGSGAGDGADGSFAAKVVDEITDAGGHAVANTDDISTWDGAEALVRQAIETFGGLDVLVNNAGILRDRMLFSMSEDDWDAVMKVHLKGTFSTSRHAAAYWRSRAKGGMENDARLINTSSISGLYANPGQCNYGAAKAGVGAFTQIAAQELARYGVTVNAVAPGAATRLTADLMDADTQARLDPRWVATVVVWLASPLSKDITGQMIESSGDVLAIAEGWRRGPAAGRVPDDPAEVDKLIRELLAKAQPRTSITEIL